MTRDRSRAPRMRKLWWVAAFVAGVGGVGGGAYLWVTRSASGRAWLLKTLVTEANAVFKGRGRLVVGTLRGVAGGKLRVDSVALLDSLGVPVITARQLTASLDIRALLGKAVHLDEVTLDGVDVDLRQDAPGRPWNIVNIISGPPSTRTDTSLAFGDVIRIDRVTVRRATIRTQMPWAPHRMFTGAARDSVAAVRDSLHDIIRAPGGGWYERRRIELALLRAHDAIINDRGKPRSMQVDSLQGTMSDPPVPVRHAQGVVSWTSDSLMLDLARVALPASTGSARGTVSWNNPGPVHMDITIRADAGLSDLGWIWDALPSEGRGRAVVRMRSLVNADDVDYALDSLDVVSGASRVQGRIAVTTRPADLLLHGVDLAFVPLRSDLARRLSYGTLPDSVRGSITGRLIAEAGGPLTALKIDRLDARFADEAVKTASGAAALSSIVMRGEIGIGVEPRARGLVVDTVSLDVASMRRLAVDAPAVDGRVDGRLQLPEASLASVAVRDMTLAWTDAVGNRSVVRGDGRARIDKAPYAVQGMFALEPLSMRALARVDTTMPSRALIAGTVRVDGRTDSLRFDARLRPVGDAALTQAVASVPAAVTPATASAPRDSTTTIGTPLAPPAPAAPTVGTPPPPGPGVDSLFTGPLVAPAGGVHARGFLNLTDAAWRVRADALLSAVDAQAWLDKRDVPSTALGGAVRVAAGASRDASAQDLTAQLHVALTQRATEQHPAAQLEAAAQLTPTRVVVDSALLLMGGVTAEARGALARTTAAAGAAPKADTLVVAVRSDSLDGARPELRRLATMLAPLDSALAASLGDLARDTLQGDASVSGYLTGDLERLDATIAIGGRALQVGAIRVGRLFGSVRAADVRGKAAFEGAATADEITGIGAVRIQGASFRVAEASPDSGRITLDVNTETDAHFIARGAYRAKGAFTAVSLDSVRLTYDGAEWTAARPVGIEVDSATLRITPSELRSTQGGVLAIEADLPPRGALRGAVQVARFPIGEVAALFAGVTPFDGTLTGEIQIQGTRAAPLFTWSFEGDSLGVDGWHLPRVTSTGDYADRRLVAQAFLRDTLQGALHVTARMPIDLSMQRVEKRQLSDVLEGELVADSLRLDALPLRIDGVTRRRGVVTGRIGLSGTFDRPVADGTMRVDGFGARLDMLGTEPSEGVAVIRARGDSIYIEQLRVRSGAPGDTLGARGVVYLPAKEKARVALDIEANSFDAARQRDGTDLDVSGKIRVDGQLDRPVLRGNVVIPRANLVVNPLGARNALDLSSQAARKLLGAEEVPVAETAAQTLANLGRYITVEDGRVDLGSDVWVQTPEARVKLSGGLAITMSGEKLALLGEIAAERGQYRLDLGVVNRSFAIDSGRVRFFGNDNISPTLDITATNVIRVAANSDIPVRVHIGGTYDRPVLTLTSTDATYASAPESEIISLLIFGVPTFALGGQERSTVQAVTGVLLPTVGGAVEGALQRLLPVFNTVQVTAGSQERNNLTAAGLLDNLSISAGKQLGERTFLRLNTGICRGSASNAVVSSSSLMGGVAAEYRIGRNWWGQVGVDAGSASCTNVSGNIFPRLQFGFDLFREWIF